jgi:Thiol-disulfide isomerase and thioredoxins
MLFTFENEKIRSVDTTMVNNGTFYFYGEEYTNDFSLISIGNHPDKVTSLDLILDNGNIFVNLTDSFGVKGTYLNDALVLYRDSVRYYFNEANSSENKYKNATQSSFDFKYRFKKEHRNDIVGRKVYIEDLHNYTDNYFTDSLETYFDELYYIIFEDLQTDIEVMQKIELRKKATMRFSSVGKSFINFDIKTINGELTQLADYIGTPYLLIEFWASWCGPCIAAMPELEKIYQSFKDSGFSIIGISLDDNELSWEKDFR